MVFDFFITNIAGGQFRGRCHFIVSSHQHNPGNIIRLQTRSADQYHIDIRH